MSVVVIVHFEAVQGQAAQALQVLKGSQEHCLTVEGCEGFEVLQSQRDEHRFTFIERWASVEQHKALLSEIMGSDTFEENMKAFQSGPDIAYYSSR